MKGSVVVLLGCFAFFAAPSHSYSVKFISEDDQIANRQDRPGSSSPDVATTRDTVEGGDTSSGMNKTVNVDGDAEPGNESVSDDAQTKKSNIQKRDTRTWVGELLNDVDDEMYKEITREDVVHFLKSVGDNADRCFQQIVRYLDENELERDSYGKVIFTRPKMIAWLKIIRFSMSHCLRILIEPYTNGTVPPYVDYDTPPSVRPRLVGGPFTVSEMVSWFEEIGKRLDKCLQEVIQTLGSLKTDIPESKNDPVQRTSETFSDLLAELIEVLSQIDGRPFVAGEPIPMLPPELVYDHYPNSGIPLFPPSSGLPPYPPSREISILPQFLGFRDETEQSSYPGQITTLPEDVHGVQNPKYSLLDLVLDKIYSKFQGKVSPGGNALAGSLGDDANGILGSYRSPRHREGPDMEMPSLYPPDYAQCMEKCLNRTVDWKMVNRG